MQSYLKVVTVLFRLTELSPEFSYLTFQFLLGYIEMQCFASKPVSLLLHRDYLVVHFSLYSFNFSFVPELNHFLSNIIHLPFKSIKEFILVLEHYAFNVFVDILQ